MKHPVRRTRWLASGLLALLFGATGAFAHHSTAMFDMQHTVVVTGTVTEFQWTNPHTFIFLDVPGAAGAVDHYGIEGMSPNYLNRNGWTRHTLKPGDKVGVEIHPLKDGRKGGFCATVKFADGTIMYNLPRRTPPPAGAGAPAPQ